MKYLMILLCSLLWTAQGYASIGNVILHEGNGEIERTTGESQVTVKDLDVFSYDVVKTGNGKTGIEFVDETRVDVTQHSKLIIDEFVYKNFVYKSFLTTSYKKALYKILQKRKR